MIRAARFEKKKAGLILKRFMFNKGLAVFDSHLIKRMIKIKPIIIKIAPEVPGNRENPYIKKKSIGLNIKVPM